MFKNLLTTQASRRVSIIPSSGDSAVEETECNHLSTLITSSAHSAFELITLRGARTRKSISPTWTYSRQQDLVREELESRSQEFQMDRQAFRKLKAELRKTGATTGFCTVQLLNQQVTERLSKRRSSEAARSA